MHRPALDRAVVAYTTAGNYGIGWVVVGALSGRPVRVAATVWGTLGVNYAVKLAVGRERPAARRCADPASGVELVPLEPRGDVGCGRVRADPRPAGARAALVGGGRRDGREPGLRRRAPAGRCRRGRGARSRHAARPQGPSDVEPRGGPRRPPQQRQVDRLQRAHRGGRRGRAAHVLDGRDEPRRGRCPRPAPGRSRAALGLGQDRAGDAPGRRHRRPRARRVARRGAREPVPRADPLDRRGAPRRALLPRRDRRPSRRERRPAGRRRDRGARAGVRRPGRDRAPPRARRQGGEGRRPRRRRRGRGPRGDPRGARGGPAGAVGRSRGSRRSRPADGQADAVPGERRRLRERRRRGRPRGVRRRAWRRRASR